ncbi:MAG: AAA family ATPase [Desulfomonile tiedjei]|uniref:endopeptidase La n=1 Tax=Desulfomonile tiedjei TaxID=2358 RepID=A0A9D6VB24_9BACT|nr:AAA family ATPase [Desulfomonile tiedjei]
MFPVEFDHRVLDSLPLPDDEDVARVTQILNAIVVRRLMPYFKRSKGTAAITAARILENLTIERLDDAENRVRVVSVLALKDRETAIQIHERVFDYFAFVFPSHPESRLGEGSPEERKVLAFAEFLLRHQVDHLLYSDHSEREVLNGDAAFAMERRSDDPTYYRSLRYALSDEMNGVKGGPYLAVFDSAEQGLPYDSELNDMLNSCAVILGEIPGAFLQKLFPALDVELKTKVLGACYRKSRDSSYSLLQRTSFLQKTLRLFVQLTDGNKIQAEKVFDAFKESWGLFNLMEELGIPVSGVEGKSTWDIFPIFRNSLRQFYEESNGFFSPEPPTPPAQRVEAKQGPAPAPARSLGDRIEDARKNLSVPRQVIEILDKNKLNAIGHSGTKYSELLETLLAVPWGKIQKIDVSPDQFETGLDKSHYGLRKPKEIICDFFTNLIWRYRQFKEENLASWRRNGSSFLFVGPPGVGKTSLAISIAENLRIPYHKLSLGGMRDEADLKGHGFTYEGSKPGAILQGMIKMGIMNGMFIMDEADKTEKFAIATLLEILDPEQNHLFHDKYTETTIDIDLSNLHFILTANTLETVPPAVINRCEIVFLDRYSVEEKVCIAKEHLIARLRKQHQLDSELIFFDEQEESDLLRYLIKTYTHEAGVRELERIIRTLFLRILRIEILAKGSDSVRITRDKIKECLEAPRGPRKINPEDRVGEMMALGVNVELGVGSIVPIQATQIEAAASDGRPSYLSMVHATGNLQRVMDESRKVAATAILYNAEKLGIDLEKVSAPIHLHFMGGSTPKDGPSAGGAIALALASVLSGSRIRRDIAMTGEIDTHGRITVIGSLDLKLETAYDAGCKSVIIPRENLYGEQGVERLSDALKSELQTLTYEEWKGVHDSFDCRRHALQIIAVDNILHAAEIAFIDEEELKRVEERLVPHGLEVAPSISSARKELYPCFSILYVKDARELDGELINEVLRQECGFILLTMPKTREEIVRKFPGIDQRARLLEFDPLQDDLAVMLQNIEKSIKADSRVPVQLSMLAPYFFLMRQGVCIEGFAPGPSFEGFRVFANNYTAQGFKIKGSKALLNRVYQCLSPLRSEQLEACPFLANRDGIYVVDLSFIPEKYRLDETRAEQILNAGLKNWLAVVEEPGQSSGPSKCAVPPIRADVGDCY